MDKNTLSNYGWIVVMILCLSVLIALATPFGGYIRAGVENTVQGLFETEDAALGKVLDDIGIVPTTDQLQSKHKFDYYNTFRGAVADVNANTIGVNADCNKEDATAGVYTDNGEVFVVLLKDTTETSKVTASVDMTINLGGNTLTFNNSVIGIDTVNDNGNTINIDGRLEDSEICVIGTDSTTSKCVQATAGNIVKIKGVNLTATSDSGKAFGAQFLSSASGKVINCNITIYNSSAEGYGVYCNTGSTAEVENCTITSTSETGQGIGVNFSGTNQITNSSIISTSNTNKSYGVYLGGSGSTVKNCTIKTSTVSGRPYGVYLGSSKTGTITNCTILSETTSCTGTSSGIYCNSSSNGIIENCTITTTSASSKGKVYGVAYGPSSIGSIKNCDIKGYSNYLSANGDYTSTSYGIYNFGSIAIKDSNVIGTHSGITGTGNLTIDGGIYEGYGHGGFYVGGGTSYIENATIRECDMPEGYSTTIASNHSAFYIGGANNTNIYMNNCYVQASGSQTIVLRGTDGEKNCSLYISNSIMNTKTIRIDNNTHKTYIGKGNNFTAENTTRPSSVIITDETYCQ